MSRTPWTSLILLVRDEWGAQTIRRRYVKELMFHPQQPRAGEMVALLDEDEMDGGGQQVLVKIEQVVWQGGGTGASRQVLLLERLTTQEHNDDLAKALTESGWDAEEPEED